MNTAALDPLASFRLDGKVAVITGASSGIGERAAHVLAALGATVVVAARRLDRLETLAASLPGSRAIQCDVSDPGQSASLVAATIEQCGRLDVVVANAGISNTVPALREELEDFARVVHVDLVAQFELAQAAARQFRTAGQGGSIVMMASAAAFTSTPVLPQAAYVAAKTGLVGPPRELRSSRPATTCGSMPSARACSRAR